MGLPENPAGDLCLCGGVGDSSVQAAIKRILFQPQSAGALWFAVTDLGVCGELVVVPGGACVG